MANTPHLSGSHVSLLQELGDRLCLATLEQQVNIQIVTSPSVLSPSLAFSSSHLFGFPLLLLQFAASRCLNHSAAKVPGFRCKGCGNQNCSYN